MDDDRMTAIADATRLTRQGRVADATALIQRNLGSAPGGGSPPPALGAIAPTAPLSSPATTARWRPHRGDLLPTLALQPLTMPGLGDGTRDADPSSPGGQFLESSYSNAAGTRRYMLYVPTGYRGQDVPLVVMLHGGTQAVGDFAVGTGMNELAEADTFLVAYPEQASSANPMKYWHWFEPGHQVEGTGEPSLIGGITQRVMGTHTVDAGRVYIAGFSAGGAMAAVMAATHPHLYAAVGVHSGLPYGAAHDVPSAFAAMSQGPKTSTRRVDQSVPLIVFHGDRDSIVGRVNAERLVADALSAAGPGVVSSTLPGRVRDGHAYTRTVYENSDGRTIVEQWIVHQAGHAWSGGRVNGSYTDWRGPDASAELIRFFGEQAREVLGS